MKPPRLTVRTVIDSIIKVIVFPYDLPSSKSDTSEKIPKNANRAATAPKNTPTQCSKRLFKRESQIEIIGNGARRI